jgi:HK97 gp10 family phage protein
MSVVIIGLPQALAKIAAIPIIVDKAGEIGLEMGKALIAEKAKQIAPRRTGRMASRIVAVPEGVAALEDYSRFVERGTRFMQAQAYMGPALEAEDQQVSDLVSNTVRTALYAL